MKVTATTMTITHPSFKFVRGYYDAMDFEVILRNDDPVFDVVRTLDPDVNFNFSVALGSSDLGMLKVLNSQFLYILIGKTL